MSFLVIARERHALPVGETPLGGTSHGACASAALASLPLSAIITVHADGSAVLRHVSGRVLVNGESATGAPVRLRHGMRLEVAGVTMLYGDRASTGTTTHLVAVSDEDLALLEELAPVEPTAPTGGRLVDSAGLEHHVPDTGLTIGRDPDCEVVLPSKDISRVHARITPGPFGYVLTDLSANGTFVNGARMTDPRLLANGDVLRLGREELRFTADEGMQAEPLIALPVRRDTIAAGAFPVAPATAPLATLEVIDGGALHGMRFHLEHPVAHVGRGAHNDVRLRDDSVSGAHATLTRRGAGWVVFDVGSTNGTCVDGARIAGEHPLDSGSELQFGEVRTVFRLAQGATGESRALKRA